MARTIKVELIGDSRSLERAFKQSNRAGRSFSGSMSSGLSTLAKSGAVAFAALGTGALFAGSRMVSMASDAAEVRSKMKVIFGKELPGLTKNLDAFSRATGASRFELREQVADMGALLEPLTASKGAAAEMSAQFVKLATDLGSFNNVPVDDALLAIRSGLVGESEPLRRFGVLLNEAAVKAEGLRLGLVKGKEEMTEQQKVQARASLIMQQTTLAQGDATRTAGSMANQMKALRNNISDAATSMGTLLIPYALQAVKAFNENWPQIEKISTQVLGAVIRGIEITGQVVDRLIRLYADVAAAAQRYWPMVQQSAQRVVAWYQGTLGPAITNVLASIRAAWASFGPAITRITQTTIDNIRTIFVTRLRVMGDVIEALLAVIRGDWSEAWKQMKQAVVTAVTGQVAVVRNMVGLMRAAAVAVGRAMIEGIGAGIDSMAGWLVDKAKSAALAPVNAMKSVLHIGSPSQLAADEIGTPIAQGIGMGFVSGMSAETTRMTAATKATLDRQRQTVEAAKAEYRSAWDNYTSAALAAFDDMASKIRTKSERLLDQLGRKSLLLDKKQAARDVADTGDDLRGAKQTALIANNAPGVDPEARKAANDALFDAQMAYDRAVIAQQELTLNEKAANERKAQDEQTANDRLKFQKWLETRSTQQQQMLIKEGEIQSSIVAKIKSYDGDYRAAGVKIGTALATGLNDAAGKVRKAANNLAGIIDSALGGTRGTVTTAVDDTNRKTATNVGPPRASGGPVFPGVVYPINERGIEGFSPSVRGNVIPASQMTLGGGRGGNTTIITASFPNYVGDKRELISTVREGLADIARSNGGRVPGLT